MKKVLNQSPNECLTILDKMLIEDTYKKKYATQDWNIASITQNIYNLLNSRCYALNIPNDYPDVERSILTYGLNDYSGNTLDDASFLDALCQEVHWAIERFEPRLKNVVVKPVVPSGPSVVVLFEIGAYIATGDHFDRFQLKVTLNTVEHLLTLEGMHHE